MTRLWAQDGSLAGARYDAPPKDGKYKIGLSAQAGLSADNEAGLLKVRGIEDKTTVANEKHTHLKLTIADDVIEYFSLGSLLGTGQASRVGDNQSTIVSNALGEIRKLRQQAVATLEVFSEPSDAVTLGTQLRNLWDKTQGEVNKIFGSGRDEVSIGVAENDEEILEDFDEVIAALSDASAFAAATNSGGSGVFKAAKLSAAAAQSAFDAEQVEATARFGSVGNTRFGTFWRKQRGTSTSKLGAASVGAFAYGTNQKTLRTRYVRQGTGSALYLGETEAIDGKGNFFSGDIEIRVRFAAEKVNAVITNLADVDGAAWEYQYGNTDVDAITLPDVDLGNAASWSGKDDASDGATISYVTRGGIPRPVKAEFTFAGQLLGRDEGDQGNEAVGIWSVGASTAGKSYLAGGFGATRGADLPDLRPEPDSGTDATTAVLPNKDIVPNPTKAQIEGLSDSTDSINRSTVAAAGKDAFYDTDNPDTRGQTISDGMLTVIGRQYDKDSSAIVRTSADHGPIPTQDALGTFDHDNDTSTPEIPVVNGAKYRAHKIDLEAALDAGRKWSNGDKHIDLARKEIEKQLRILESDIGLTTGVKTAAWNAVRDTILDSLFGIGFVPAKYQDDSTNVDDASTTDVDERRNLALESLPGQLGRTYNASRNADFVDAVEEVLEALESNAALKAALDVKGIFYREASTTDGDDDPATLNDRLTVGMLANKNGKGAGDVNLFDRRNSRVQYLIASTDFTRFGAWRRQTSPNAKEGYKARTESDQGDGPNSLAYSQLGSTVYNKVDDPSYPKGARMTYQGGTIAVQAGAFFEGQVELEVLWDTSMIGGDVNMTISEIENFANGARMYLDPDNSSGNNYAKTDTTLTTPTTAGAALEEVVSIKINDLSVDWDSTDTKALSLALGSTGTGNNLTYISDVVVESIAAGSVSPQSRTLHQNVDASSATRSLKVDGRFVGQGLSGPLAVLGTFDFAAQGTLSGNTDVAIGSMKTGSVDHDSDAATDKVPTVTVDIGRIHGGFGAEAP